MIFQSGAGPRSHTSRQATAPSSSFLLLPPSAHQTCRISLAGQRQARYCKRQPRLYSAITPRNQIAKNAGCRLMVRVSKRERRSFSVGLLGAVSPRHISSSCRGKRRTFAKIPKATARVAIWVGTPGGRYKRKLHQAFSSHLTSRTTFPTIPSSLYSYPQSLTPAVCAAARSSSGSVACGGSLFAGRFSDHLRNPNRRST